MHDFVQKLVKQMEEDLQQGAMVRYSVVIVKDRAIADGYEMTGNTHVYSDYYLGCTTSAPPPQNTLKSVCVNLIIFGYSRKIVSFLSGVSLARIRQFLGRSTVTQG